MENKKFTSIDVAVLCQLELLREKCIYGAAFYVSKTRENTSSTDWDGFIRGLKAINFDDVLSFETAPVLTAFPDELKEEALRMIVGIGRYLVESWSRLLLVKAMYKAAHQVSGVQLCRGL